MSSTFKAENEKNVKNILIKALALTEADVIDAHKDVERCEAAIKHHTEMIEQLRNALAALGRDSKKSKGAERQSVESFATSSTLISPGRLC
ncbi:MAG: hypothetical protein NTW48_04060 [Chloroflexi bacterium]|nr:hypothetical protein [Chloroflexota bacterium]